jgi:hypothetical protein
MMTVLLIRLENSASRKLLLSSTPQLLELREHITQIKIPRPSSLMAVFFF